MIPDSILGTIHRREDGWYVSDARGHAIIGPQPRKRQAIIDGRVWMRNNGGGLLFVYTVSGRHAETLVISPTGEASLSG